ncbi:ATP-binding cassette transporter [Clonorchis sinensis]|uniref:ATP-binding cassette transporter n=1 Tax=Clonorchis sinensis TaxID=79923 RepID=H2KP90_CLOSI|nr:ATP-binding cassette transporter [Clonorchis sinensis]
MAKCERSNASGVHCGLSDFSNSTTRLLDVVEIASLDDVRKSIPTGNEYDGARKSPKHQIVKSQRKDRELWWISEAREMEKAFTTGDSRALYQLVQSTGSGQ